MIDYLTTGDDALFAQHHLQEALDIEAEFEQRALRSYRWVDPAAMSAQTGMLNGDEGYVISTGEFFTYLNGVWELQELRSRRGPLFGPEVLTYGVGFTEYTDIGTAVWVINGLVFIRVAVQGTLTSNTTHDINQILPPELFPAEVIHTVGTANGGQTCSLRMESTGEIFARHQNGSSVQYVRGILAYPADW